MKRHLVLLLTLVFSVIVFSNVLGLPRDDSYRQTATGYLFKNNFDRLNDNPAYVGANLSIFDYIRVKPEGGEKEQKSTTDLYSTLDGLNTDGRFLLGGLTSLGFLGIGGYVEMGISETPQLLDTTNRTITSTTTGATSTANLAGTPALTGYGENSNAVYYSASNTTAYSHLLTIKNKEENNLTDSHLNFRLVAGGLAFGPLTAGLAFERNTEGSDELIRKGEYQGSVTRLSDNFIEDSNSGTNDEKTVNDRVNYMTTLGLVFVVGGVLQTVELMLGYNIIQYKIDTDELGQGVISTGGVDTTTTNTKDTTDDDRSGGELDIMLMTRERIAGWNLQTYISLLKGGENPYNDNTVINESSTSTTYFNNADRIDSSTSTSTVKSSGNDRSRTRIKTGLLSRKEVAKGLLFGFGILYSQDSTKDEYKELSEANRTIQLDDGDGIPESADRITVTSGSFEKGITTETKTQTFTIPMGLEFQATPSLSWRIGAIHTTTYTSTITNTKFNSLSALYDDVDRTDIAGNETDDDARVNPSTTLSTTIGAVTFDPTDRDNVQRSVTKSMTNQFFIGLGYLMQNKIQLDLLLQATANREVFSTGAVYASATYMIE